MLFHVVDRGAANPIAETLQADGFRFRLVAPFGDGRFCNKLRQLESPEVDEFAYMVLCDADIAFAAEPRWPAEPHGVCARIVDGPNPPLDVLTAIYRAAGRKQLPERMRCGFKAAETYADNCNGGIYVVPRALVGPLRERWQGRAGWLLDRPALIGDHGVHVDQVSFALAMHDLGAPVSLLPAELNFPTHLAVERYDGDYLDPVVLHHHNRLDANGELLGTGVPRIDAAIARVNAALRSARLSPAPAAADANPGT